MSACILRSMQMSVCETSACKIVEIWLNQLYLNSSLFRLLSYDEGRAKVFVILLSRVDASMMYCGILPISQAFAIICFGAAACSLETQEKAVCADNRGLHLQHTLRTFPTRKLSEAFMQDKISLNAKAKKTSFRFLISLCINARTYSDLWTVILKHHICMIFSPSWGTPETE
jgi:hypothetical protein